MNINEVDLITIGSDIDSVLLHRGKCRESYLYQNPYEKQDCIPVGCVPTACISGGGLP